MFIKNIEIHNGQSVLGICLYIYFQAGQMTQIGVLENLKMENVTLSHKLTETKHQSIKEKERIAVQLQSIEVWHTNAISSSFSLFLSI